MKQFLFACVLLICMNSCTYGQNRSNPMQGFTFDRNTDNAIRKVNTALLAIENLYVDTININKLAEDAIIGLLEKLDPHSAYLTAEEVKESNEPLQGNFEGIGIQFNLLTDTLYVVHVISGGPSEKVGIMPGDKFIFVNDTLIAGVKIKNTEVLSKLRGPKGTVVNVKVLRRNQPKLLDFKIIRDKIPLYSLNASYMIDKKTGYIKIDNFSATTFQEFKDSVAVLKSKGMENLILDLLFNGGGYLGAAVELANEFLSPGSLIVYTEGVNQRREEWKANSNGSFRNGKLVILVNEYSASASEILSGAVQDWDRGVIIGRRTFGKGMVQRPVPLPDGSVIRLTTAYYYTPTGRSIQKPFVKGDTRSYQRDFVIRFNRGEMISADSIHFPDSLKRFTLKQQRPVYGGGGIMPDYFIPIDTANAIDAAASTALYIEINNRSIIYKYTRTQIEANRDKYKKQYPDFNSFNKNFVVTGAMLNDLFNIYRKEKAEESGVTSYQLSEEEIKDFDKVRPLILQLTKMFIAREIYGENAFYQMYNPYFRSDFYNKAIEIINNEEVYNKLLNKN